MHFLVYISASAYLMDDEELKELLLVSRKNNTERGVTGLLLYHDGNFIQVLEGEKEIVKELYDKIAIDNRHGYLFKLLQGPLEKRNFPEWSMGFRALTATEYKELNGYRGLDREEYLTEANNSNESPVMILIKSFVNTNVRG